MVFAVSTLILAGALYASPAANPRAAPPKLQVDESELPRQKQPQLSYKSIVDKVAPVVVNIYSTKTVKTDQRAANLFGDPFFRQFFGMGPGGAAPQERQEQSLGSGVIVTSDGYIVTNNHVVDGADSIRVALANGEREFDAKVIGTDPQTDIAVVKVDAENLPTATLGDSDKLAVGDVVLAIGNPFGVGQTVTQGIAGAVGRGNIGIETYEDFIQTDASINPGNSGGPLIDGLGRVVGINTAILSRTGGNQGVGFAVPINLTRYVFDQVVEHGKVTRGFLGVVVQPVTSDLAQEFNLKEKKGALIADVRPGGPAEKAGLQAGDVIVGFDSNDVRDSRHLQLLVAKQQPDTKVAVRILRDGTQKTVNVMLAEQPKQGLSAANSSTPGASEGGDLFTGMQVQDLTPTVRSQVGIPEDVTGAVVTEVAPGSPGAVAGLQPGFVILGINHHPVKNAEDAMQLSSDAKGDSVLLRVWTPDGTAFIVLKKNE